MDKQTRTKIMKIIIIAGIIIIPLMYSFFYLKAFWDPYGNLKTMPVAIVNEDKGEKGENLGQDLVETIQEKDVMKFEVVDQQKAQDGLVNQDYYAVITIPSNFTTNLNNSENEDRQMTTITYSPNQKSNYLASQIIGKVVTQVEIELKGQIAEKVVDKLSAKLSEVPEQMEQVSDGAAIIKEGTNELENGMQELKKGTSTLAENYNQFNEGVNTAYTGSNELVTGSKELDNGINQIYDGAKTLADSSKDLNKIATSAEQLSSAGTSLNKGVSDYVDGVNSAMGSVNQLLNGVIGIGDASPALLQDPNFKQLYMTAKGVKNSGKLETLASSGTTLKSKMSQFNTSLSQFKTGSKNLSKLTDGTVKLEKSLLELKQGSTKLVTGTESLNSGLQTLNTSSEQVKSGITQLDNGTTSALEGTQTLQEGVGTFKTTIDEKIEDTKEEVKKLDGLGEYTKEPIKIEEQDYAKVESYGVGFAPYFMSISLWVGALVMFVVLYYDPENRFKLLGKEAKNRFLRAFLYAVIAAVQAIVLGFLLKLGLGYTVTNIPLYYLSCILISEVFMVIIQFLIINFGDIGKFLSILMLVLQLAASGGTFPIETVPEFFQKIYPFMPMNYTIRLLKESLVMVNDGFIGKNVGILIGIFIAFMIGSVLLDIIKLIKNKLKKEKDQE